MWKCYITILISEPIGDGHVTLFFLGHMCWGYVFGKATSHLTSRKIQVPLVLMCGALPDIDLLLNIEHGGIMHSIVFWFVAFIPILIWIGPRRSLPYLISVLQHPLFGDFITANYKILLPFSYSGYGIGLDMLSPISLSLEVLGFLAFVTCAYFTKDLMSLFSMNSTDLLSLLPAAAMLVSIVFVLGRRGWGYVSPDFEATQALFLLLLLYSFFTEVFGITSEIHYEYKHLGLQHREVSLADE